MFFGPREMWVALVAAGLSIWACWLLWGPPIAIIGAIALLYLATGQYWPGPLQTAPSDIFDTISANIWYDSAQGILGSIMGVVLTTVLPFIILGSILEEDEQESVDPDTYRTAADRSWIDLKIHALHHRIPDLPHSGIPGGMANLYTMNRQDVLPVVGPTAIDMVRQDHIKGRYSEVDLINGKVVEENAKRRRASPANEMVVALTRRIHAGDLKLDPANLDLAKEVLAQ